MKSRITLFVIILNVILISQLTSCKDDSLDDNSLDSEQLIAGRIDGTWANPDNIITPDGLPDEIFGDMELTFTTDEDGYPSLFLARNCPVVFSSSTSNWSVNQSDSTVVSLEDVSPVDEFTVEVSSTNLIISFYMGWENTDTGDTGEGQFSATLTRQ